MENKPFTHSRYLRHYGVNKDVISNNNLRKFHILVLLFLLNCKTLICQVNNDSCLSATEILPSFGINASNCFNGILGYDVSITTSNINSVPNLPYPAMKDCRGYSNFTSVYANDVWFKLKTLGGVIDVYRENNSLDSIHLNIWHGNNCSNLKPSGCFTFDLVTPFEQYGEFCGDTVNGEYTYLQFSGNDINKVGGFGFCIKGFPCSNIWYFGTTDVLNYNFESSLIIYPNPVINLATISTPIQFNNLEIAIYDIQGKLKKKLEFHNSHKLVFDRENLVNGLYFIRVTDLNSGKMFLKSIAITN